MIILGGQSALDVDTASPKLKQLVSISSRHRPPCLFYCGESEPRGFNKAIISVSKEGLACLSCFSFFLHRDA